jgi:hypothetical protein
MPLPPRDMPFRSPTQPFDGAAIEAALEPGLGEIDGQAFSRTVGGEVRYAAGIPIFLMPLTSYVRECLEIIHSYARSDCGMNLGKYRRETVGDGEGRFKFKGLKPGSYYIEATITWGVPTELGVATTGGTVHRLVTIPDPPEAVEAVLN